MTVNVELPSLCVVYVNAEPVSTLDCTRSAMFEGSDELLGLPPYWLDCDGLAGAARVALVAGSAQVAGSAHPAESAH